MEFSPGNPIVKRCLQGMNLEEKGQPEEAKKVFLQAWNEAGNDYEKFLASYYVARHQEDIPGKLAWLNTCLQLALKLDDLSVKSALSAIHSSIAKCYEALNDTDEARKNQELAQSYASHPADPGPFYHGTKADLKAGDLLKPGNNSNYHSALVMNHIYFTALPDGAGLAAALAQGDGAQRVYIVEPTGDFESDPNVTDKKFPGNPTRSYRSQAPLRIAGELKDWKRISPEELQQWREKLANNKGEIIN